MPPTCPEPDPAGRWPEVTARAMTEQERLQQQANRLDLVSRWSDDLAHEIKNPLHAMVINLELVKRRAGDADPSPLIERAEVVESELHRVHGLVDSLLKLVRPWPTATVRTPYSRSSTPCSPSSAPGRLRQIDFELPDRGSAIVAMSPGDLADRSSSTSSTTPSTPLPRAAASSPRRQEQRAARGHHRDAGPRLHGLDDDTPSRPRVTGRARPPRARPRRHPRSRPPAGTAPSSHGPRDHSEVRHPRRSSRFRAPAPLDPPSARGYLPGSLRGLRERPRTPCFCPETEEFQRLWPVAKS
jgi:hypothetical protein